MNSKTLFFFWSLIVPLFQIIHCNLERIKKLIIAIDDKIRDGKIKYDVNREAAKLSALSLGKIDKYEYLIREEILTSDQSRIKEQAKITYSPLGKAFAKQTKTIESQGKKQIKHLKSTEKNQLHLKKIKKHNYDDESRELLNKKNNSWPFWRKARWNIKIKGRY